MLVPVFRGAVTAGGVLHPSPTQRTKRAEWLACLVGQEVEIIVRPVRAQRTTKQNNWIHGGIVLPISRATGDDPDAVKADLMRVCWGSVLNEAGQLESWIAHTSSMDVQQADFFIEWAPSYALQKFDLELPLPNEAEVVR